MSESAGGLSIAKTVGILLGIGVLVGGLVCLVGYCSKCSKCGKWFSQSTVKKVKIKEEDGAKDVERSDKHYDKEGNMTGETRRKERVYGKYITYDQTVRCSSCNDEHQ